MRRRYTRLACKCFNSILVRLKATHHRFVDPSDLFQFHTGSIKSTDNKVTHISRRRRFQFHTGSIKSEGISKEASRLYDSFNSILVRLKVSKATGLQPKFASFNSILVRLKVDKPLDTGGRYFLVSIPYWFD